MKVKRITYAGKADVYNMEVEDTHNFIIQGGVISHNCADETRYFCMANPVAARLVPVPDNWRESPLYKYLDIRREDLQYGR